VVNDGSPSEDENDNYAQEKHMVVLSEEMAKEFDENRWFNLAVRGLLTEIEKCCTSKEEGQLQ
jgi:hypothetical protein